MIVFVPSWPWLSLNQENWRDDKEFLELEMNLKVTERTPTISHNVTPDTQTTHRTKGIPRSKIRK